MDVNRFIGLTQAHLQDRADEDEQQKLFLMIDYNRNTVLLCGSVLPMIFYVVKNIFHPTTTFLKLVRLYTLLGRIYSNQTLAWM